MIGPNSRPTLVVPTDCSQNSPTRMPIASGTTRRSNPCSTVASPSTADSTEIAGVIMQSPKNSAVASTPRMTRLGPQRLPVPERRWISASSARLPPSPLLSARMMIETYLTVTIIISDQNIRLMTPKMWSWSTISLWWPTNDSLIA